MKNIVLIFLSVILVGNIFAQSPLQIDCPASPSTACDVTPNSPGLWNETYWHDPVNGVSDLSEAPIDLTVTIEDTCAITSIRYLLFLDLDQNDTLETVIDSDNLPGFNNVQFGNAFNANYTGGTASAFDERAVSSDSKYGFALQTSVNGDSTIAHLAWNTLLSPGTYHVPELPYGHHKIQWIITDACGNETTCEYAILVKDCKPPTIVCFNGIHLNIPPTGFIDEYATDLVQYMEDNSTPNTLLKLSIRKSGTGVGFPVDSLGNPINFVRFDCSEIGVNLVELWSIDLAGNADFCETYVIINDPDFNCPGLNYEATTCVHFWKDGSPVNAQINYTIDNIPAVTTTSFDSLGCEVAIWIGPASGTLTVTPVLNSDPLNGLNTLDLIRISRHILGLEPLPSTYAMIAADANSSGSITTFDIMVLRRLLLGIDSVLPNNFSWRFIGANYQFPNPNNPFQTLFPTYGTVANFQDSLLHFSFIGVKVGDIDGNAYPGFGSPVEDRTVTTIMLPDIEMQAGERLDVPLHFTQPETWLGLQMALHFDPNSLEIENLTADNLPGWDENTWAQPKPGLLRMAWFDVNPYTFQSGENVMTLHLHALAPLRLRDAFSLDTKPEKGSLPAAVVNVANELQPLQLAFEAKPVKTTTISIAQPNPSQGSDVTIALQLAQTETVRLQVTDLTGQILFQTEQILSAGTQSILIPATALTPSGVYGWQVQAGTVHASGKLVKM